MKLLKFTDLSPSTYSEESRDYQLICRLYDCLTNSSKFDIDTIKYLTDTRHCRTDMLELLQTKLGFFTNLKFDSEALRTVLTGFPIMVRNKGSILGIQQAICAFLKVFHIQATIIITEVREGGKTIHGVEIPDHSLVIEIQSALSNTYILSEIFRYIFPAGFGFYIYFYETVEEAQKFNIKYDLDVLFVSDNINSQVRGTVDYNDYYIPIASDGEPIEQKYQIVGALDVTEVASLDSKVLTANSTYDVLDYVKFRGVVNNLNTISNPEKGDMAIQLEEGVGVPYIYNTTVWHKINFKGLYRDFPSEPTAYDLIGIVNKFVRLIYINNTWNVIKFRGEYSDTSEVIEPEVYDVIKINTINKNLIFCTAATKAELDNYNIDDVPTESYALVFNDETHNNTQSYYKLIKLESDLYEWEYIGEANEYYIYISNTWTKLNYKGQFIRESDYKNPKKNDLILLNGVTYYLYFSNKWVDSTKYTYNFIHREEE